MPLLWHKVIVLRQLLLDCIRLEVPVVFRDQAAVMPPLGMNTSPRPPNSSLSRLACMIASEVLLVWIFAGLFVVAEHFTVSTTQQQFFLPCTACNLLISKTTDGPIHLFLFGHVRRLYVQQVAHYHLAAGTATGLLHCQ
jgi:hypothetical protein